MGNELVARVENIRVLMQQKRETIFAAAAQHIRPERFIEQVARACANNTDLLDCDLPSLFMSAAEAATLGLEIDGVLGHAYLVPFRNSKRNITEAVLVPGYLGLKELAYRSQMVASVEDGVVHDGDDFDYRLGTSKYLEHKPAEGGRDGAVTHVYAIVHTTTGGTIFKVMSWAEVERHKTKFAKGANRRDSAWQTNPTSMGVKTVLRQTLKLCPLSAELQKLLQQEEYIEPTLPPAAVITEVQIAELRALLAEHGATEPLLLETVGLESLEALPAKQYAEVCASIKRRPKPDRSVGELTPDEQAELAAHFGKDGGELFG